MKSFTLYLIKAWTHTQTWNKQTWNDMPLGVSGITIQYFFIRELVTLVADMSQGDVLMMVQFVFCFNLILYPLLLQFWVWLLNISRQLRVLHYVCWNQILRLVWPLFSSSTLQNEGSVFSPGGCPLPGWWWFLFALSAQIDQTFHMKEHHPATFWI